MRTLLTRARALAQDDTEARPTLPTLTQFNAGHFLYFRRLLDLVSEIDGSIVECGVGVGRTFLMWALLSAIDDRPRQLWGFDSFEGFPEPHPEDDSPRDWKRGQWAVSTPFEIRRIFLDAGFSEEWFRSHATLVPGFFEDSLSRYSAHPIAILHLDCDLYKSYLTCLTELYPLVVRGGIVAFDEYFGGLDNVKAPGAVKAIQEFFGEQFRPERDPYFGKYYFVKPL